MVESTRQAEVEKLSNDGTYYTYQVQQGESLMKIAYVHKVSKKSIIELNNIGGEVIWPGQVLKLRRIIKTPEPKIEDLNFEVSYDEEAKAALANREKNCTLLQIINDSQIKEDKTKKAKSLFDVEQAQKTYFNVFEQFSNFSKNFGNRISGQTVSYGGSSGGRSRYEEGMSQENNGDQALSLAQKEQLTFDENSYFVKGDQKKSQEIDWESIDVWYHTKTIRVKGRITLKNDVITFSALKCDENKTISAEEMDMFEMIMDYLDLAEANELKFVNETAITHSNAFIRETYKFNYYLQIVLSAVNGLSVTKTENDADKGKCAVLDEQTGSILKRSEIPIANIFFQLQHTDKDNDILPNTQQAIILQSLIDKITKRCSQAKLREQSCTFVPFYDSVIQDKEKQNLGCVQMSNLIAEKVTNLTMKALKPAASSQNKTKNVSVKIQQDQQDSQLIKYRPTKSHSSSLLNDYQISNMGKYIPGIYKRLGWKLLYRLNEHGSSMHNFYKNVRNQDVTLLIIMDKDGWKFGSINFQAWHQSKEFYGTGENMVFTYRDTNTPSVWRCTGKSTMFQFSDLSAVAMGGGKQSGRFALYLGERFLDGSSTQTICYENEQLSCKQEFQCVNMEVWGFE